MESRHDMNGITPDKIARRLDQIERAARLFSSQSSYDRCLAPLLADVESRADEACEARGRLPRGWRLYVVANVALAIFSAAARDISIVGRRAAQRAPLVVGFVAVSAILTSSFYLFFNRIPTWTAQATGHEVVWSCTDDMCAPGVSSGGWTEMLVVLSPFLAIGLLIALFAAAGGLYSVWERRRSTQ